jgi:hypothetical protein
MNLTTRSTRRATSGLRSLIAGICTAAALAIATQAAALTNIGAGAFSGSATTLTFESLPGDGSTVTSFGGVSFQGATESDLYTDYGPNLANAATSAGLGNVGATWGCNGSCGTGFTLPSARNRVGAFLSSNVDITVQVDAYRSGVLLGSQTLSIAADQIGFVGFEDANGIDQLVIGDNTDCTGCIHQLDNVKFENAGAVAVASIPTMSQWGMITLASLLALGAVFALRRRRQ